jgi:hypothetical protein
LRLLAEPACKHPVNAQVISGQIKLPQCLVLNEVHSSDDAVFQRGGWIIAAFGLLAFRHPVNSCMDSAKLAPWTHASRKREFHDDRSPS